MHMASERSRLVPAPLYVQEDADLLELWCDYHGRVAVFSTAGVSREELEREATAHLRQVHGTGG